MFITVRNAYGMGQVPTPDAPAPIACDQLTRATMFGLGLVIGGAFATAAINFGLMPEWVRFPLGRPANFRS